METLRTIWQIISGDHSKGPRKLGENLEAMQQLRKRAGMTKWEPGTGTTSREAPERFSAKDLTPRQRK